MTANLRNKNEDHFIGLWKEKDNLFSYEDNTDVTLTKWAPNKPDSAYNTDCVTMSANSDKPGLWENVNCNSYKKSICAKYPNEVRYLTGCEVIIVFFHVLQIGIGKTYLIFLYNSYKLI